jgi:predicted HAD superfamily phosphohydrolase YqeG
MGTDTVDTLFVGDQIFTDIWGANKAGIYSILVGRIGFHEEIQIHLKRIIEQPVLWAYRHKLKKAAKTGSSSADR